MNNFCVIVTHNDDLSNELWLINSVAVDMFCWMKFSPVSVTCAGDGDDQPGGLQVLQDPC